MKIQISKFTLLFSIVLLASCASTQERLMDSDQDQLGLRQAQTRAYDSANKEFVMTSIIATLQDLGFVVDSADIDIGLVTATKLDGYALKMSVVTRPRGQSQMIVRANAELGLKAVSDPEPYQNFFAALSKSMFLEAHNVE